MFELYGGENPRNIPNYTIGDISRYLAVPTAAVESWMGFMHALIEIPMMGACPKSKCIFSFTNLVEAQVLAGVYRYHKIQINEAESAVACVRSEIGVRNVFANIAFLDRGIALFVKKYSSLIQAGDGKRARFKLAEIFNNCLARVEFDSDGFARRIYPFAHASAGDRAKPVMIDPHIGFGLPVMTGTGISTDALVSRYRGGESIDELAEDYNCPDHAAIERAIQWQLSLKW